MLLQHITLINIGDQSALSDSAVNIGLLQLDLLELDLFYFILETWVVF